MNIQQALVNPDKTPLTELEFTAVALYPGKTLASGDVMTKVMVDTPQGTPNCYVTFFTPQAPAFVKGDVVSVKAQITPQGAKGVTVSEFPVGSGKKGINVNKEATWTVGGVAVQAATPQQPIAQTVAATPEVVTPAVVQPLPVVEGSGGSVPTKLTREELLRELSKVYSEARAIAEPTLTFSDEEKGKEFAHQFALQAMTVIPTYWFGEKMCY